MDNLNHQIEYFQLVTKIPQIYMPGVNIFCVSSHYVMTDAKGILGLFWRHYVANNTYGC